MTNYETGEQRINGKISFETGLSKEFGIVAIAAYSTAVMDTPRLDIFGIGIGGSIMSEILKIGNALYFGACDKNFYAVSLEGKELWRFPTNHINLSPATDNEKIYFGSFDNNLYALNLDGKVLWKFETNGMIASKPCIANDAVYFGSKDGNLYCVSSEGRLLWKFQTPGPITQDPVFYKGLVYIGSDNSNLYAVDSEGNLVRKITSNGAFGTPVIENDTIYVGSFDKNFYAFTLEGKLLWRYKTPAAPATRRPLLYNNIVFCCSRNGTFWAFKTNGELYRKFITNDLAWITPVTDGKSLYVGSGDSNFYAFDIQTGRTLWRFPTSNLIASSPVLDNGIIYFGGWDCNLYAVTTQGKPLWKFQTSISNPAPAEPEEEFKFSAKSQLTWQPITSAEEKKKYKKDERDIGDYGTFSGQYIDTSKSDYLGRKKKGYM